MYLRIELLGLMLIVTLYFTGWGTVRLSQGRCSILHPQKQCKGIQYSTSLPALVTVFFVMVMLMGVKHYLSAASICIYLMTNGVDHLFMSLLAIYISSVEDYLFRASAQFLIELSFYSLLLIVLYTRYKFLIRYMIYINVLQFCEYSFLFLVSFEAWKF